MVRLPLVSCLLPALAACQGALPTSLRGAVAGGDPAQNASHPQEAGVVGQSEELLNATFQLSALAAYKVKTCSKTKKAKQCLMVRAKKADQEWSLSWTNYSNSDRWMTGPSSIRTDCSGFVRWALEGCGKEGLGKKVLKQIRTSGPQGRTRASNFYDAFGPTKLGSSKWCAVPDFRKVNKGDVLVYKIKGTKKEREGKDTGHIMIAYKKPIAYNETHDGKLVFVQKIIDSSAQPHFDFLGDKDTRYRCKKTEKCGAGVGYVFVFTDKRGKILAIRIRGPKKDRNAKTCTTKSKKKIACFSDTNHKTHLYRVGRLLR